ncbi:hypothetical protein [Microbulbifer sp. DLAB2-AA]|uniref:hypothetical protein n=1 Tax=Microbulbifer sp. DLAB2-AA TaxID=3243394 RepID=UPI0040393B45
MNKIIKITSAVLGLTISSAVFSATCSTSGYDPSSYPKGSEYPAVGVPTTFYHDTRHVDYSGKKATFSTSTGFMGWDEYNYQDFKWRAKESITFTTRGPHWVTVKDPLSAKTICNDVSVQNKPKMSLLSFSSSDRTAKISYTVDEYSKFAKENKSMAIVFRWRSDFYGTTGSAGGVTINGLSGTVTGNISVPGGDDLYEIDAVLSDGTYTAAVNLGYIRTQGDSNRPCERCNKN